PSKPDGLTPEIRISIRLRIGVIVLGHFTAPLVSLWLGQRSQMGPPRSRPAIRTACETPQSFPRRTQDWSGSPPADSREQCTAPRFGTLRTLPQSGFRRRRLV